MGNTINGLTFQGMLKNALFNLINAEKELNSMNVFPVADGDTGTNMRLTLEHGYKKAKKNKHLGEYLKEVASGMLLGARGNSGVILSQLFKGMSNELESKGIVNPKELKNALISAYKVAYNAVINPVEGTILTVAKEGIENIKSLIQGDITIAQTMELYLSEMNKSLKETPNLLPTLKEANVLDSGAYGYIKIVEGMNKFLNGEILDGTEISEIEQKVEFSQPFFDENSQFVEGYCTEFLLQLMNSKDFKKTFNLNNFIETIKPLGNSIVALQEGTIVKVHIHTLLPQEVIAIARQYGEFISFKMENMQLQHNEFKIIHKEKDLPRKSLAIIAVVDGDGLEAAYRDMGVDIVIQGGQSMNTSTNEFVNAMNAVNADNIVIFPNNVNIIGAAKQAIELLKTKKAFIIPSRSVIEGFYALQVDLPEDTSENRINAFKDNINAVDTITVSSAIKNYDSNGFKCAIGDKVGTINDELVSSKQSAFETFKETLSKVENIDDKFAMVIFKGKSSDDELMEQIQDFIYDNYSNIEATVIDGGENIYDLIVGLF